MASTITSLRLRPSSRARSRSTRSSSGGILRTSVAPRARMRATHGHSASTPSAHAATIARWPANGDRGRFVGAREERMG
jgi:hypothetical protein